MPPRLPSRTRRAALLAGALLLAGPVAAQWAPVAPLGTARSGAAVAVYNGQLWVMGGRSASGQILGSVERFDPATGGWLPAPPLREPRVNAAAVVIGSRLVLTGGRDEDNLVTDDSEVFDPSDNRWESFSNLRHEREGHAAFAVSGVAYAFGGSGPGGGFRADAETYDPSDGNWRDYGSWNLAIPRASFAAAPLNGGVVVIGGYSTFGALAEVELYTPGQTGTLRAPLPTPRGGLGAATLVTPEGVRIYAVGGREAGGAVVARVDVYDPAADAWAPGLALPAPREGAAVAVLDGRLYVAGGRDAAGAATATTYVLDIGTPGEEGPGAAGALALTAPAPNPTAGAVGLALRTDAAGPAVVEVFDALGRRVAVLHDGPLGAGAHALGWDGRDESGRVVPAGAYVVRARQGAAAAVRRLTVAR